MRTPKELYSMQSVVYTCELETCPRCGSPLVAWPYVSGPKTLQTLTEVLTISQRPKHCADPTCPGYTLAWKSAA
jgi:rRNA maturation protein Nop10